HAFAADQIGVGCAAAANGRAQKAKRQEPVRVLAGELHAGGAAKLGADQVTALEVERVEKKADVGGKLGNGPAITGRLRGSPKPRQVGPDNTKSTGKMRHPRSPGA